MRATLSRVTVHSRPPALVQIVALLTLAIAGTCLCVPGMAQTATCTTGRLDPKLADGTRDLIVNTGPLCTVAKGTYKYKNVNVYGGGTLSFNDEVIDFYASSILVENDGSLVAGTRAKPVGSAGGSLTIHIYGAADKSSPPHNKGITCKTGTMCGVSAALWSSNATNPNPCVKASAVPGTKSLPGGVDDCFYAYSPIDFDDGDPNGYFGTKVLGVSYGGTLQLFGQKGAQFPAAAALPASSSGTSWVRLNKDVAAGDMTVVLDRVVTYWKKDDHIVITSTDYFPGHAEEMVVKSNTIANNFSTLTVERADSPGSGFQYAHKGSTFDISSLPAGVGPDPDKNLPGTKGKVETRAAVGLLTRSIRIVSEGDDVNTPFAKMGASYSFGAHTMVRQGFKTFQVQGVEFYQLGQGGEIMHYPVHFHMARKTPQPTTPTDPNTGTYVKDCTIRESMTRWITLHATQGVTLARNVGYLSIGHGFYLEDGTETDNKFYSNLGVFARAAVDNPQNPRKIPGILSAAVPADQKEHNPFDSDVEHPSVFWITNNWNDFQYNMAAGAGSCGMCYWLAPIEISGHSRMEAWTSYASELINKAPDLGRAGSTPLKSFRGNSCSAAQYSFITVGDTAPCRGVIAEAEATFPVMPAVPNPLAPPIGDDTYYPKMNVSANLKPTVCPAGDVDCSTTPVCSPQFPQACTATNLNYYTTSYNWAQKNLSAVWLRQQWYLFRNSAITDVQNGGITLVTGGDYTPSSVIPGYWSLAYKNVFVGETQPGNPFAMAVGPFNPMSGLKCALTTDQKGEVPAYCLNVQEGVSFPLDAFSLNQRFFNIYDGPSYQSSNAYLNITPSYLKDPSITNQCTDGKSCLTQGWMYGNTGGLLKDGTQCYQPNAAIGWKQPNTFYYPPAFRSTNLFFSNVSIRHFVVEPLFSPGTYNTDTSQLGNVYCASNDKLFEGFTDTDRQTELTDEDGTLTGLQSADSNGAAGPTISVNQDLYFNAGRDTRECASDVHTLPADLPGNPGTARTSPYEYVTTVEYPDCVSLNDFSSCGGAADPQRYWARGCETNDCYGVKLYRMSLFDKETKPEFIRMAGAGIYQRSTLTVNHATYYMDTTASFNTQDGFYNGTSKSIFKGNGTYYTFFVYAPQTLDQTYQIFAENSAHDATKIPKVRVIQVTFDHQPFVFNDVGAYDPAHLSYDGKVLTVHVDTSVFPNFKTNYDQAKQNLCQPANYCSYDKVAKSCGCATVNGVKPEGCDIGCVWAGKDVDCPAGGCYGFAITFPDDFVANDQGAAPPAPVCPAATDPGWNTKFQLFTNSNNPSDVCKYGALPPDKFKTTCP